MLTLRITSLMLLVLVGVLISPGGSATNASQMTAKTSPSSLVSVGQYALVPVQDRLLIVDTQSGNTSFISTSDLGVSGNVKRIVTNRTDRALVSGNNNAAIIDLSSVQVLSQLSSDTAIRMTVGSTRWAVLVAESLYIFEWESGQRVSEFPPNTFGPADQIPVRDVLITSEETFVFQVRAQSLFLFDRENPNEAARASFDDEILTLTDAPDQRILVRTATVLFVVNSRSGEILNEVDLGS